VRTETLNGLFAVVGGAMVAVLAFVPMAALHYRRSGRLRTADLVALVAVPVYALALWTYTLLPLPAPADVVCRPALLEPFHFTDDVRSVWDGSFLSLLRDTVFLQLALNVALFVPMGVLLRLRYRRGIVVTALSGMAMSLLIETTQLTGIWGLYDCAYRFFDVDDLLFNTAGAVLGSLAVWPLSRRAASVDTVPERSTFGRRLVAIISDLMTMVFVGAAVVVIWRIWLVELGDTRPSQVDPVLQARVQWGAAFAVQAACVLTRGCTVGELVVRVRTVSRSRLWTLPSRMVKLLTGAGAVAALGAWDSPRAALALWGYLAAVVIAGVITTDHRGLSNQLSGLRVVVLAPDAAEAPDTVERPVVAEPSDAPAPMQHPAGSRGPRTEDESSAEGRPHEPPS